MKCFGHIFHQLMKHTKSHSDPYQFAYKHNRITEGAALTLLHNAYTHLENPGSFVRILFTDFSSAFNTVQLHLMASKLLKLDINARLILWIVDFLVNHSQTVCHQAALLSSRSISTGSPQGTVLSPILSTIYTNDCTGTYTTISRFCNRRSFQLRLAYHSPPTHETHEAPFRSIQVCVQAQQKHQRRNTHSFAQCTYTS